MYTDLANSSAGEFSFNQCLITLKCSSIVNLNIDTSFVGISALGAEISILKAQIRVHLQTRTFASWPIQIHEAHRN